MKNEFKQYSYECLCGWQSTNKELICPDCHSHNIIRTTLNTPKQTPKADSEKKVETVLDIAMKNTYSFLDEQSGLPKEFLENVTVVPLHCATDVIKDMADQIERLTDKLNKSTQRPVEFEAERYAEDMQSGFSEDHKDADMFIANADSYISVARWQKSNSNQTITTPLSKVDNHIGDEDLLEQAAKNASELGEYDRSLESTRKSYFKQGANWRTQHPDPAMVDRVLEYVSHNISEIFMKADTLAGQKRAIKSMRDDILKGLSK